MSFVSSGSAALEALAERPRDIVVSDMRMPGMDGAELLYHVRERYPRTARLILSGRAENDGLMRALPVAQQVLCKPCECIVLCEAIDRLLGVQTLLANERIQSLVGKFDRLTLFPACYQEVTHAMTRPQPSMAEIIGVIERQPTLSTIVLSVAGGGYFGRVRAPASIAAAIELLGLELLRALALSTDLYSQVKEPLLSSRTFTCLPQRALLKARFACLFVSDPALGEEAFETALLMDVGNIVLAQINPSGYLELLDAAERSGRPLHELEREHLGCSHAEISAYLLGIWGLPARVVEVVSRHHPPEFLDLPPSTVAAAVHVADVLVEAAWSAQSDPTVAIDARVRERPEVSKRLGEWRAKVHEAASALGWRGEP